MLVIAYKNATNFAIESTHFSVVAREAIETLLNMVTNFDIENQYQSCHFIEISKKFMTNVLHEVL